MREMTWGWLLEGVSPLAKLLAIRIGDLQFVDFEAGPLAIEGLAKFACTDIREVWKAIDELVQKTGLEFTEREDNSASFFIPIDPTPLPRTRGPDASPLTIYVMACGDRTKVGISRDVERRHLNLQGFNALAVTLEHRFDGPAHIIRRVERAAHSALATRRVHGEWYSITPNAAISIIHEKLGDLGL